LGVSDGQVIVSDSKNADDTQAESRKYSLEHGKKSNEVIKVHQHQYIHLSFRVKNLVVGRSTHANQVLLKFRSLENKNEATYFLPASQKGYRFALSLDDAATKLHHHSGLYRGDLVIGDPFATSATTWHFADFQLNFETKNETNVNEPEPILSPKKEIHHVFREADTRAPAEFATIFTGLVLSPLLLLVIGLILLGANLRRFPGGLDAIWALGFIASFGAILALLWYYWLALNMFQTLGYLGVLTLPVTFFGNRALRYLSNTSSKAKKD